MQEYGFNATFFVVAGRVDRTYHLTRDYIKKMVGAGMEIGSHGLRHKYLTLMDYGEIERELHQSKSILESITKQPVDYFSFPGGRYNRKVLQLLPLCGYKGVCSCLQGLNGLKTNSYLLKRIEIRKKYCVDDFSNIFRITHITFYQFIDLWKSLIRRSIGLNAYGRLRSSLYKFYIFKR